jgi:hypothetical protein
VIFGLNELGHCETYSGGPNRTRHYVVLVSAMNFGGSGLVLSASASNNP